MSMERQPGGRRLVSVIIRNLAMTGLVTQGNVRVQMTLDAIRSVVAQVSGERAIPLSVEHDPFCLPIGKVVEAWVEPLGNEHIAKGRIYIENPQLMKNRIDPTIELVRFNFANYPKPFQRRSYKPSDRNHDLVSVDLNNFANLKNYDAFAREVSMFDQSIICNHGIRRHSIDPAPLIEFITSPHATLAVAILLGKKIIDHGVTQVLNGVSALLTRKVKQVVSAYQKHHAQDNRGTVVQTVLSDGHGDEFQLILLIKIQPQAGIPELNLAEIVNGLRKYIDSLPDKDIDSVTVDLSENRTWGLRYMTTRSGKVIGTKECYEYTLEQLERIQNSSADVPPENP